jgi:hypothetical protein
MLKYERDDEEEAAEEDYPGVIEKEEPVREEITSLEEIALENDGDEEGEFGLNDQ